MDRNLAVKKAVISASDKFSMAELLADHQDVTVKIKKALQRAVNATGTLLQEIISHEKGQETLPTVEGDDE